MEIPVYLFAGFLDSGKTTFINGVLQDGFALEDRTLLLCCEEGNEEYDPKALRNVDVVNVEGEVYLTKDFLKKCEKRYKPRQIMIEFNGMWSLSKFYQEALPSNWILYQIMTTVEAATFDVYAKNLGQMMMEKLTNADMIIFNRCDEKLRASLRARNLKLVNRRASMYLENTDGTSEEYDDGSVCPFDLSKEVIDIPDDDFGVWYVDVMDHAVVAHLKQYPGEVVLGRFAMTCCAADISFLGVVARGGGFNSFGNRAWVEVTARMALEPHKAYEDKGPILYVTELLPAKKPEQEVLSF